MQTATAYLNEKRGTLVSRYEALASKAKSQALTTSDKDELKDIEAEIQSIDRQIDSVKNMVANGQSSDHFSKAHNPNSEPEEAENSFSFQILKKTPVDRNRPTTDFVRRNFDVDDRILKANVWSVIAAMAGRQVAPGSPTDIALSQVKSLTGSALLTEYLSAQILDGALARSYMVQEGMQIMPMLQPSHRFARIAEYPVFEWKAAYASTTERTTTFDSVTLEAKTLRGFVNASQELVQDGLNFEAALRNAFTKSLAQEIDRAALYGSGIGEEPLGVANYPGLPVHTLNANLTNYDPFVLCQQEIFNADGADATASVMSPDAWAQLQQLKGQNELQPLMPPPAFANHRFLQTSKAPTDTGTGNQSEIVMGDFSHLMLGVRLQAQIQILPTEADKYQNAILGVFRGDIQPDRIENFGKIAGVDPIALT